MNNLKIAKITLLTGIFVCFSNLTGCTKLDKDQTEMSQSHETINAPFHKVSLSNESLKLTLLPNLGGSIHSLSWNDISILRQTISEEPDIVETASFPLVPIVNRIPDGHFTFEGKSVQLEGNFMGLPDFIHGHGWREAWQVISTSDTQLVLQYDHAAGNWPWSYTAYQTFNLLDDGLRVELKVKNTSESNMPADLGFHPYFPATPDTILQMDYDGYWRNNDKGQAVEKIAGSYRKDFTKGADLIDDVMTDQTHMGIKEKRF